MASAVRQLDMSGGDGDSQSNADMIAEAKTLRQHKSRLEARMKILEDHNKQLEAQLHRLKLLLDQVSISVAIVTITSCFTTR